MNKIASVCVYSASSTKIDPVYFDTAYELGTLLGQQHIRLINGAGNMGLMSAVSDAALAAGGEVTGVIPRFMVEQGWHHTGLTRLVEVESMHERKKMMADLSVKGYFDPLLAMLQRAVEENFMRTQHGSIWHVAKTVREAVELVHTVPLWDVSIRKFAAI